MKNMHMEELKERLQQIGAGVSEKTLRRWGETGIIKDHLQYSGAFRPGKGRGNAEDWPEESLLQAAGVWAIQKTSTTRLTVPELLNLRIMGDEIQQKGRCKRIYPDLNKLIEKSSPLQSLRLRQDTVDLNIPTEKVQTGFDVFDDDPLHDELYATYVCAKEKAWHSIHSAETWPITKPVWAYLYYVEEQRSVIFPPDKTPEPYPQIELSYSRLEQSTQNRPFFFFDGRDARAVPEYISIHVGDKEI